MDEFYEMVRKWTVHDYRTPGIKAEVILDMLLSEFVTDIVGQALTKPGEKQRKFVLLAKEFPVKVCKDMHGHRYQFSESYEDENISYLNAKIDYLLACPDDEELCFVELKTSEDSYEEKQLIRMLYASRSAEELFSFYNGARKHSKQKEKYQWQYKSLASNAGDALLSQLQKSGKPIRIVYLTLNGLSVAKREGIKAVDQHGTILFSVGLPKLEQAQKKWTVKVTDADAHITDVDITVCHALGDDYLPAKQEDRAKWALTRQILQGCISDRTEMPGI